MVKYAKDPKAPKRPSSGYFLFMAVARPALLKKKPAMKSNIGAIGKALGQAWGQLSEAEKAPYMKKAAKAKAVYQKKNIKYRASRGYAKWLAGKKEFNKQNKSAKEQKKLKKMLKNKPKRGLSAYMLFGNANRKKLSKPGMPITEVAQAIGAAWGKADDATKAKFQKVADKAKIKAQKALAKYKKGREYKAYLAAVADCKARAKAEKKAAKKQQK
jgi:uncharacterized protein with PIN domain